MNLLQRMDNEKEILSDVARGDEQAFRTLYLHYYNRLFQFAMYYLGSEPASEDVVEDIFFNVWKGREKLTDIPNFRAYIYQSVRNGCYNVLKSGYVSKRTEMPDTILDVSLPDENPFDALAVKELGGAIAQAVNNLPEKCRMVFKMFKEDGMSQQEIADVMGVQLSAVQRHLYLAKQKIKEAIAPFLSWGLLLILNMQWLFAFCLVTFSSLHFF